MTRSAYHGTQRKLVLAFDVGTTFSGISYTVLTPGEIPNISGVNRFPAQENVGGDSKIPSIIYYDKSGRPRAMGAEALDPRNVELAADEGWQKVEWFKMHLRPRSMGSTLDGTRIPALPRGKTIVDVFADFFRYLFDCTRAYISETYAAGHVLWNSVEDNIHFILTHPNGWQGPQQTRMRKSAIIAGLIPDTSQGRSRVQFVTEGEASLHFCIHNGLANDLVKPGNRVVVADAGGGTIDISSYRFTSVDPLKVEESSMPECKVQGSVFVTRRSHAYLKTFLCGSKYGSPEDIDTIAEVFDKTTKRIFRDDSEPSYVKFAMPKDKDIQFNIRNGQLKLDGSVVAAFFESSVESLVTAIKPQNDKNSGLTAVFLVGGFAASPWLFGQLEQRLSNSKFSLCRPDSHTNKAVADGAISFYFDHFVTERVARTTLGVRVNTWFQKNSADHRHRSTTKYIDLAGAPRLPDGFETLLKKGTSVSETTEFRRSYTRLSSQRDAFNSVDCAILSYAGNSDDPKWVDEQPEDFVAYCKIVADMSNLANSLSPRHSATKGLYFEIHYDIVVLFGLTETQALLSWTENGVLKRSPATIVYNESIMDDDDDDSDEGPISEDGDGEVSPLTEDEVAKTPEAILKPDADTATALEESLVIKCDEEVEVISEKMAVEAEKESSSGSKEDDWELA